jgi:hypothetical protein
MLVGVDDRADRLSSAQRDRHDFFLEHAGRMRGGPALLAAQRERVLVGAADAEFAATFSAVSGIESMPYWPSSAD